MEKETIMNMRLNRKIIICIVLTLVLTLSLIVTCTIMRRSRINYSDRLISALKGKEQIRVQDIFSFEFDRAYIFDDCYISGEGFAQRYDLDISIAQVKSGQSENIQRIVFVDKDGNFLYEFRCDSNKIVLLEKGLVIYPQTVIEKRTSSEKFPLTVYFKSSDHY